MKPKYIATILLTAAVSLFFQSCEESNNIGSSLVKDQMEIIVDSAFTVTGKSVINDHIQSRTITQVLGSINAGVYGSLNSEFVTQFMPAAKIDTTNVKVENIDSLKIIFRVPTEDIVGDSLIPMGLEIYPLIKRLPSPIYSDFSPEGYYDPNTKLASVIYKANAIEDGDTLFNATNKYVTVDMPRELGQKLYSIYKENPANYSTPSAFADKFPGIYVTNSYGSGRVIRIAQTVMRMFYHKDFVNSNGNDTTVRYIGYYYAVQPEVITNNIIDYKMGRELTERLNNGENIVVAPAGRDIEINFPAREIIKNYNDKAGKLSVLNTLTFRIPVEEIENDYSIAPPTTMLMILSKDKDKFFIENHVNDDVTSFIATYNSTNKCYDFTGMRAYLLDLMKKESITPEDYTFTLTPVSLMTTTETSSNYYYYTTPTVTVNAIVPYVSTPTMAKIQLEKAKIVMTFSKQLTNF